MVRFIYLYWSLFFRLLLLLDVQTRKSMSQKQLNDSRRRKPAKCSSYLLCACVDINPLLLVSHHSLRHSGFVFIFLFLWRLHSYLISGNEENKKEKTIKKWVGNVAAVLYTMHTYIKCTRLYDTEMSIFSVNKQTNKRIS